MAFRCTKPTPHPVKTLAYEPWALTVKPFQVSPRTWYVAGQTWVGCYLIDTGSGLILIDTAIPESMYLLVDSIYRLGYKPEDIKKILLSHAHFDHCGAARAMKELTGASVYLSSEDYPRAYHRMHQLFLGGEKPCERGNVCGCHAWGRGGQHNE